jgi:cardiolipin synthase
VHVLLDWVGSQKIEKRLLDDMRDAGVQIRLFHPLSWYHIARMNNRTHRKILVVDGGIGFTGGVGIADKWDGNAQDADHWRDSHYRVEGPVVAQMQATFIDNWTKVSGDVLHGADYLPAIAAAGDARAQMFSSSPDGGAESMQLMYLLVTTAATRTIDLASAYFVPDELTSAALVEAMRRGVRFRLIVPGPIIDTDVVRRASRSTWGPLLAAGAEIHEYQPTMFHCKVMIVDRLLVSVGSTNFDPRSFRLNDEANLNIYDTAFAASQTEVFERDLAKSRRVTLAEWEARPWHEKLVERTMGLLGSQL